MKMRRFHCSTDKLMFYLPLPCTIKNAGAHRTGHGNPGGAIRHITMNHGREAGATAMACEMAGMVPLGVPLLFFRCKFFYIYPTINLSGFWLMNEVPPNLEMKPPL